MIVKWWNYKKNINKKSLFQNVGIVKLKEKKVKFKYLHLTLRFLKIGILIAKYKKTATKLLVLFKKIAYWMKTWRLVKYPEVQLRELDLQAI